MFDFLYCVLCRDRSSPLCHIRVGLTSCIGAGHIVFFAGIDSTGNQVTCWTSNFVVAFLMLLFLCLFVYLFVWSYPPSFWFKDRLIYSDSFFLGFWCLFVCIVSMYAVIFLCFLLIFILFSLVYVSFCFPDNYFDKYHLPGKLLHFYGLPFPCRLLV